MNFWVGITDENWFRFLRERRPDEVNFWQPSAARRAVTLEPGAPFLFKLHSPKNFIVGGGFYVRYSALPAHLAWEAFDVKNGVTDYRMLRQRVEQYRSEPVTGDPEIGCHILNGPVFLDERDWIPTPPGWARNIVQGRTYDADDAEGRSLWEAFVAAAGARIDVSAATSSPLSVDPARYGDEYLARARLGQGAFRVLVTDAYQRRCAITGERTLPVLEAAHIRPYADEGPHRVNNGLLLRSDLHKLFDDGYLTVTPDMRIEISGRIREEFENGREYYQHHGQTLRIRPASAVERPSAEFIRWHNENVYLG